MLWWYFRTYDAFSYLEKTIQRSQNLKSDAFFHFSFVKALRGSTLNISLTAVMWMKGSSSVVNTFKAKAEAELWLTKLYFLFHMQRSCVSLMSALMVYNTENLISKISLGKVSIPKTFNETWDKTYMQSQGVSRQNLWLFSCARTHTNGHPIVWWEIWKSLFIFLAYS